MKQKHLKIGQRFACGRDLNYVYLVVDKRFFNVKDYKYGTLTCEDAHAQIKMRLTYECVSLWCNSYPNVPFYGGEDKVGILLD